MNIMIVDDEKLLRKGFQKMTDWNAHGIHIIAEAMNGVDALEKLKILDPMPDVIITDIKMPLMDGVQLTKKIKSSYPQIEVIILSAHDDYEYVRDSMKFGAYDYLLKASIDTDDIYKVLQNIQLKYNDAKKISNSEMNGSNVSTIKLNTREFHRLIEVHDFEQAKLSVIELLKQASALSTPHFQEVTYDIFFFLKYTLDTLGFDKNILNHSQLINRPKIHLLNSLDEATKWFSTIFDEFQNYYLSMNERYTPVVKDIVAYIEEHYNESLSLDDLSERFYINKNYLCNIFKSETGNTIIEYMTNLRIEHAKQLIRISNQNLFQIASNVGYNNYSYFGKVFKKNTGISPNEYANLYK